MTLHDQGAAAFIAANEAMAQAQAYFRDVANGFAQYDPRRATVLAWTADEAFQLWRAFFSELPEH